MRAVELAGGAAFAGEGAHQVVEGARAGNPTQIAAGAAEMFGGAAGAAHGIKTLRAPGRTPVTPVRSAAADAFKVSDLTPIDARAADPVTASSVTPDRSNVAAAAPAKPRVSAPLEPDIRELHGGIGIVGRSSQAGEAPVTPAASDVRASRAVRTLDPATAGDAAPPAEAMAAPQQLTGISLKSFDPSIQPALREVIEQHQGFAEQRRGVQTVERTQKLAEQIAVDVSRTLPKGRVLNAEETTAFANTLATLTDRIKGFADRAGRGELDDAGRMQLEEARRAQVSVMTSLWGSVTEQGRALNAWKSTKRILDSHDAKFIKQALEHLDDSAELASLLEQIGDDPVQQYAWLKEQANARRPVTERLSSYFYANILSGVATHERNILSNSANLLFGTVADVAAGRVGQARASVAGMWDALTRRAGNEGPYAMALPRAFQELYFNLRKGFSPTDVHNSKLDFGRAVPEFAGGAVNPFNWPTRALNAADGFFRALVRQGESYRAAYSIAKRGGEGTLEARMADALNNLPEKTVREIDEMTARAVFQETPGAITRAFLQLRETVPGLRYVVPFVRIAANLTRQGLEASPAGFAMKRARTPGRVGDAARAKAGLGSVALLPIAYYASMGKITGSGPTDPGARQAWLASGKRPNSILNPVSGEWVSYTSWQPVALPMSIVANLIESYRDSEARASKKPGSLPIAVRGQVQDDEANMDAWVSLAEQTLARTADSVLQQSFLSGVSSLVDALNDPKRDADRFFTSLAQGFVPLSGAMRTATQLTDPVVRTPDSIREGVAAIVPGLSKSVPPLIDRFGRETHSAGAPLTRGFYQASPSSTDPLQPLLERADIQPVRPLGTLKDKDGREIALSPDEQTALRKARGQTRRRAYESVAKKLGDRWQQAAPERLNDLFTRASSGELAVITGRARRLKASGQTLTVSGLIPAHGGR